MEERGDILSRQHFFSLNCISRPPKGHQPEGSAFQLLDGKATWEMNDEGHTYLK